MDINWWYIWDSVYHMMIAFALAMPLGLDREKQTPGGPGRSGQ